MGSIQENLLEQKHLKQKRKQFFIFLIILLTLIVCAIISTLTIIKHHPNSHSVSTNSPYPIKSICRLTRFYDSCIKSISTVHTQTPSNILRLSIRAAFYKFYISYTFPGNLESKFRNQTIAPALMICQDLFIDSLSQLNKSMIMTMDFVSPKDKILDNEEIVENLRILMINAMYDVDKCLKGLEETRKEWRFLKNQIESRIYSAKVYMLNSLDILDNKNVIHEIFYPRVGSIMAAECYMLSVCLICTQYLVLVLLCCFMLRVMMSKS